MMRQKTYTVFSGLKQIDPNDDRLGWEREVITILTATREVDAATAALTASGLVDKKGGLVRVFDVSSLPAQDLGDNDWFVVEGRHEYGGSLGGQKICVVFGIDEMTDLARKIAPLRESRIPSDVELRTTLLQRLDWAMTEAYALRIVEAETSWEVFELIRETPTTVVGHEIVSAAERKVGKASRVSVEQLKRDWANDPHWDLHTAAEGIFEAYAEELQAFEDERRAMWRRDREEQLAARAEKLGCFVTLAEYIEGLEDRLLRLERAA